MLSPETALNMIIDRLRSHMALSGGKRIPKDLAVVLTKSDTGIFGADSLFEKVRMQQSPYDPELAHNISEHCKKLLLSEEKLNAPEIVTNAETNFAKVHFFAVSALGNGLVEPNGVRIKPDQWRPRRVEEPFLWILHQWGIL
jgi:hypothetical protein